MVLHFRTCYVINCSCWPRWFGVWFSHFMGTELHACGASCHALGLETPTVIYLLFSLAEVPWSWIKIKFWDVSIWIEIWKEEIERWVWSGNAIVTGDHLRNVNTAHVRALEIVLGSMPYTCRAGGGRHTFFTFPAFRTTSGACCRLCASERGGHLKENRLQSLCSVMAHHRLGGAGFWCLFYKDLFGERVDEQCTVPSFKLFIKYARSKLV